MAKTLSLPLPECKELLAHIVDDHEEDGAHKHGDVLDDGLAEVQVFEYRARQRQGDAVGNEIADDDVQRELRDASPVGALIMEGEPLVEEVAEDAAEEIVAEGRQPIGTAEHVVKYEHDGRSEQCVDDAHDEERDE